MCTPMFRCVLSAFQAIAHLRLHKAQGLGSDDAGQRNFYLRKLISNDRDVVVANHRYSSGDATSECGSRRHATGHISRAFLLSFPAGQFESICLMGYSKKSSLKYDRISIAKERFSSNSIHKDQGIHQIDSK